MESNPGVEPLRIKKWNYCSGLYSSEGYGAHSIALQVEDLTLYYSYDTVVAFSFNGKKYTSENCWSRTTGKHLNQICNDKSRRIKRDVFEKLLNEALGDFKWHKVLCR